MAGAFKNVVEEALSLTVEERLRLAAELLHSVEPADRARIEDGWEKEIQRRIASIDSGGAKSRSWDEIKKDFDSREFSN